MLSVEEFDRLQKLSCLSLSPEETDKFSGQLSSIVRFLSTLAKLSIDDDVKQGLLPWQLDHTLSTSNALLNYPDTDFLFHNVKHEKLNRSIVIKSVVED